jgi:hypothetical protein
MEQFISLPQKRGERSQTSEYKSGFVQCSGKNPHSVLLQETGMLEAASARAMQYNHLGTKVTQSVESGDY